MIPKIVHQVWVTSAVPAKSKKNSDSFKKHLPDWEYRLWDDQATGEFLNRYFPEQRTAYSKLATATQKTDLLRYMLLFVYGGLYADMDCECLRPIDFVEEKDELIVAPELVTQSPRVMELYRTDLNFA